jgi:2-polyprenyl-6-methoxyphenol hydroxylase-like FAD-dependent oxidoreductase
MNYDVAVIGAGLAGSLSASMLARTGHSVALIDPHSTYLPDFRCEKIEGSHVAALRKTGLAEALLGIATRTEHLWVARFGRLLDIQPFVQYGFRYEEMVNAFRRSIPGEVRRVRGIANVIEHGDHVQQVRLRDGTVIAARLVILANGLNRSLARALGIDRVIISARHSICIGFDIATPDGTEFGFPALQYNAESRSRDIGYLSLFRIGASMRANFFVYHDMGNPALSAMRLQPSKTLKALLPNLSRLIGEFNVVGPVIIRPTDLEAPQGARPPGIVLIGDAYFAPCPATGRGALKAIIDAERLCLSYAPRWLAADGVPSSVAIDGFYRDPLKVACDSRAVTYAHKIKAISTAKGLRWEAERWAKFTSRICRGWVRQIIASVPRYRAVAGEEKAGT